MVDHYCTNESPCNVVRGLALRTRIEKPRGLCERLLSSTAQLLSPLSGPFGEMPFLQVCRPLSVFFLFVSDNRLQIKSVILVVARREMIRAVRHVVIWLHML